jgi:hypothetical protein
MIKIRLKNNVLFESRTKELLKKVKDPIVIQLFKEFQSKEEIDLRLSQTKKFSEVYPSLVISCISSLYYNNKFNKDEKFAIEKTRKDFINLKSLIDNLMKIFGKLMPNEKNIIPSIRNIFYFQNFLEIAIKRIGGGPEKEYNALLQKIEAGNYELIYKDDSRYLVVFAPYDYQTCSREGGAWCVARDPNDWDEHIEKSNLYFIYFAGIPAVNFPFAKTIIEIPSYLSDYNIGSKEILEMCTFWDYKDSAKTIDKYIWSLTENEFLTKMNTRDAYIMLEEVLKFFKRGMFLPMSYEKNDEDNYDDYNDHIMDEDDEN